MIPDSLKKYADAVVGWRGNRIIDAIQGRINDWENPERHENCTTACLFLGMPAARDGACDCFLMWSRRDYGFAPNPFHRTCTLATCKPDIRSSAYAQGDWIVRYGKQDNEETPRTLSM